MKKAVRSLITLIIAVTMFFVLAVPTFAEDFEFPNHPNHIQQRYINVGEEFTSFQDDVEEGTKIYSNNEEIMSIKSDGTLVAESEGTVSIATVSENGVCYYYQFFVRAEQKPDTQLDVTDAFEENTENMRQEFEERNKEKVEFLDVFVPILIVVVVLLVLAEIAYIFVTAPKFGMSRLWALAPIVGNVFGLIVFLVLKTAAKQNNMGTVNIMVCPTCQAKHPYGTDVCSICGTKLGQ